MELRADLDCLNYVVAQLDDDMDEKRSQELMNDIKDTAESILDLATKINDCAVELPASGDEEDKDKEQE